MVFRYCFPSSQNCEFITVIVFFCHLINGHSRLERDKSVTLIYSNVFILSNFIESLQLDGYLPKFWWYSRNDRFRYDSIIYVEMLKIVVSWKITQRKNLICNRLIICFFKINTKTNPNIQTSMQMRHCIQTLRFSRVEVKADTVLTWEFLINIMKMLKKFSIKYSKRIWRKLLAVHRKLFKV